MHDGTGRRVLHVNLATGLQPLLDGERRERCLVKTAENQLLFARVLIDVTDRVNSGN